MGDTENMDNGFEEFRTSLFGGYRKGDVIEYIEHLSGEIENIRTEKKSMERELKEKGEQLKSFGEKIERIMQSSGDVTVEGIPEILQEKEKEIERLRNICNELKSANESSRAAREQLLTVKVRMSDYLDILDELQQGIAKIYGSMSRAMTGIPTDVKQLKEMAEQNIVDSSNGGETRLLE